MTSLRDYRTAIEALNTLQTNLAIIDAIRKSGRGMNKNAIPEMVDWCRRNGHEPSDFNSLDAIHIAGTKGKGSTSAFVSSILCQYEDAVLPNASIGSSSIPTRQSQSAITKVGLYTSPHLRSVRERISINGAPISEEVFAHYFWSVWDRLEAYAAKHGPQNIPSHDNGSPSSEPDASPKPTKPVYFRYLTLMALHAYLDLGVKPAIFECGIGGEYDSTNILVSPSVCAVTSLGIDHTAVLGQTVEEIAWHKAGIFKSASKTREVFTIDSQPKEAMEVLRQRAIEKEVTLVQVARHSTIETGKTKDGRQLKLGLSADFQKTNASLAVAVAAAYLRSAGITTSPSGVPVPVPGDPGSELPLEFIRGLETVQWGGRCEIRKQGRVQWCLDGGHTVESLKLAGQWFSGVVKEREVKKQTLVLLFNQQTRDAVGLARTLHTALRESVDTQAGNHSPRSQQQPLFDHVLFSTNITFAPAAGGAIGSYKPDLMSMNTSAPDVEKLTVQKALADMWAELDDGCGVEVASTIEDAVRNVRALEQEMGENGEVLVLVTGSLHLVGGCLEVLDVL